MLVADILALEQSQERSGRLAPVLTSAADPLAAQRVRAAAAVVDVLSVLEGRGVWVDFDAVDHPQACLEPDQTRLVLPETGRVVPSDFVPLHSPVVVSDLDRLASGAVELHSGRTIIGSKWIGYYRLTVRRGKAPFLSGCESRPATVAPAGSSRSG